jgi:putative colanic acid biosynthesis acetyltransferase WcaB
MFKTFQEVWKQRGNTKSFVFITLFRLSGKFTRNRFTRLIGSPIRIFYKMGVQWILGIDIPDRTKIGRRFTIYHGQGLVVHEDAIIGNDCVLRHNTTIGNAREGGPCPVLGNHVEVGANSVIIGNVNIGDHSIIAAGSVVIKDVPENCVVAGNPARVVKKLK